MRRASGVAGGLALAPTLAAALLLAGCGTGGLAHRQADVARGKQLFTQRCGSCHTLADAGTQGKVGPNLDAAFAAARQQGFAQSSIQNIVLDQIRFPVTKPAGVITGPNGQEQPVQGMPANLVKGADAQDVAAYVASVAGLAAAGATTTSAAPPPPAPPPTSEAQTSTAAQTATGAQTTTPSAGGGNLLAQGKQVFETAGCTSCHTLKDAGAHGTVGPNLDEKKPPKALVVERVTNGKGVMPSFTSQLSPEQIQAVATYVSSVAGR